MESSGKVVVWRFPNKTARDNRDFSNATRECEIDSIAALVRITGSFNAEDCLGYTDAVSNEWLTCTQVQERFGSDLLPKLGGECG